MSPNATQQQPVSQTIAKLLQQAVAHHQSGRLLEAGELYQAILQSQPNHPEANHNLGVIAVQAQQPAAGLPYFMAALDADPARRQYWLNYIDALFQAGQLEDAHAVLALAQQQGLQGGEVEALVARLISVGKASPGNREVAGKSPLAPQNSNPGSKPPKQGKPVEKQAARKGKAPSPQDVNALVALFTGGRLAEAAGLARTMTEHFPQNGFGWMILGLVLRQMGRSADALTPMQKAVTLSPGEVDAHINLGIILKDLGRLEEAEASYRRAQRISPDYAEAWFNLGNLLKDLDRLDEAEANYRRVLKLKPDWAVAHNNLGAILQGLNRLSEAEERFRQALRIKPDYAEAHYNLGIALQGLGRLDEAEASFRHALRINPNDAKAHDSMGIAFQGLGRLNEADAHFQIALQINPDNARTYDNRANLLCLQGRPNEAEACYRKALQIAPDDASIHSNLGNILRHMMRRKEAETSFRRALEISPDDVRAHKYLGLTLQGLGLLDQAEACHRSALRIQPDNAEVMSNLGDTLLSMGRFDEAEASFRQALQIKPDDALLHSNLLFCLSLSPADVKSVFSEHVRFGEQFESGLKSDWPENPRSRDPERCLQIGFVSADFYNHAVASFIEPVLANLSSHPQLSLHAYYNHFLNDKTTQRLRGHFAHWHPIAGMSDVALAEKIRADGIDILIDLSGHTSGNRLPTFARKPAPVQASWIGYPGTTGLGAMDYYLADRFMLPPGQLDDQFTEKIVRLPSNAPFLPSELAPPVNSLPALGNGYVTFGSFNRPNKLRRAVIAWWSQLLRAMPDSRMLLGGMPEKGQYDTLIGWFAEEGIAMDRLAFHPRSGMENYLHLHHQVDICLDTFPYSGGTTTLHALWMGVPTFTLAGESMPGRVGVAAMSQVGLQDFIVERAEDVVERGLYWADHLSALAELRVGIRERLAQSPLRKPELIAAGLNDALRTMWQRWCAGLPAQAFEVPLHDLDNKTWMRSND